jgi:Flp pilus assembly protein TadG
LSKGLVGVLVLRACVRGRALAAGLWQEERASIVVKLALLLPIMFGMVGGTVDYGMLIRQKALLQSAADAAATAAAKEFTLIDTSKHDINAMTQAKVEAFMRAGTSGAAGGYQVTGTAALSPLQVTVDVLQQFTTPFGVLRGATSRLSVRSVAQVIGRPNICVLGLEDTGDGAIELWTNARMTAQNCAVYANSTSSAGIKSKNNARLSASLICSAGGADGGVSSFNPQPMTDCPALEDPLAGRPAPPVGACRATGLKIVSQGVKLEPGVYCGGIEISGSSVVELAAGVYVMKDGPLIVRDTASLSGEDVGFFLTGTEAWFRFATSTTISLAAPRSGLMAGLLFHESSAQSTAYTHRILSDDARLLLGTIYLPRGNLVIDANRPVADQSAYTAIVARTVRLYAGPNLVLNTNYDQSPVPVPEGIKGVGQPVALVQ